MSRPRLAIIGTGIAGLASAWFLRERHELTLFEQADYLGGHTHTIDVVGHGEQVAFDTGFMVFNRVTYPNLCRFFTELQVPVKPTDMGFSVQHRPKGLEFCGSSLNHLFAQRKNLFRPSFYRLLLAINRFNEDALDALTDPRWADVTVGDYVRERGYGEDFRDCYLVPMSSAVWSTPPDRMLEFPAVTLLRFFHNHGFLGLKTQHAWWTVAGGAREYVRRLRSVLENSGVRFRLRTPVTCVSRSGAGGAAVATADGATANFDKVILACHGDQALRLLPAAEAEERRLLNEFHYQPNLATVHTDATVMPRARLAWSAWNYRLEAAPDGGPQPQTIYWMNRLQGVSDRENYFVSLNGENSVEPAKIIRQIAYEHPLFSRGAIRAQAGLPALNRRSPGQAVYFAGSYFRYGFHEDAFASGLDCARAVTGEPLWP